MFERLIRVIGNEGIQKLESAHVCIVGIGGVGGYALEALARSGIGSITIMDFDVIELTNLNRQIIATQDNIGNLKVLEAKKRIQDIAPMCKVQVYSKQLMKEDITVDFVKAYDFIIDACDDVFVKVALIQTCLESDVPFISCMGTGNRLHPEMLEVTTLQKTMNDPLAKKIRNILRKEQKSDLQIPVVWSREIPQKCEGLGTVCPVPMAAGSLLASYVIQKLLKK